MMGAGTMGAEPGSTGSVALGLGEGTGDGKGTGLGNWFCCTAIELKLEHAPGPSHYQAAKDDIGDERHRCTATWQ